MQATTRSLGRATALQPLLDKSTFSRLSTGVPRGPRIQHRTIPSAFYHYLYWLLDTSHRALQPGFESRAFSLSEGRFRATHRQAYETSVSLCSRRLLSIEISIVRSQACRLYRPPPESQNKTLTRRGPSGSLLVAQRHPRSLPVVESAVGGGAWR